jgi:hypothetical protein
MDCFDGQTLKQLIAGRPLETEQVFDIGIHVADALE